MSNRYPIPFIGVRIHENRTPTGRRSGTPAKRAALYFAYDRDKQARLAPYQKHIDTIAPPDFSRDDLIIPPDWAARNGTVYINYDLNDLRGGGRLHPPPDAARPARWSPEAAGGN